VQGVSKPVKRVLSQVSIGVALKPFNTLSSVIRKPKDSVDYEKTSGLVYHIACRDCDAVYIVECDHFINWDKIKILKRENNMEKRRVAESFLINQKSQFVNV